MADLRARLAAALQRAAHRIAGRHEGSAVTDWSPPPPGDRREQLPDDILALLDIPSYTSTACETAQLLDAAIATNPGQAVELATWRDRLRARCRRNQKFTGQLCSDPSHREQT